MQDVVELLTFKSGKYLSRKVTKGFFCSIHALFCVVIEALPTRVNFDKRHALQSSDSN